MKVKKTLGWMAAVAVTMFLVATVAAGAIEADEAPGAVMLEPITPGTQAVYTINQHGGAPPFVLHALELSWSRESNVLQADQTRQDVAALELRIPYTFGAPHHYSSDVFSKQRFDPATGDFLGLSIWEDFPENDDQVWHRSDSWGYLAPLCGMWAPMHAAPVDVGEPVHLGGACVERDVPNRDLFEYKGIDRVGAMDAMRFQNLHNSLVQVWYNPGLQVPVKMVVELEDIVQPGKTRGTVFELTLTHYKAGQGAFGTGASPRDGPAIRTESTDDGIPDDGALELPFTLDDAVAAAYADDEWPRVAEWAQTYPDIQLSYVRVETDENEWGLRNYDYYLVWTDGDAWIAKLVQYDVDGPLSMAETEQEVTVSRYIPGWLNDRQGVPDNTHPAPHQRQLTTPLLEDVMAAWQHHAQGQFADTAPEIFGFAHWCQMDCSADAYMTVWAGVHREGYRSGQGTLDLGFPQTPDDVANRLYVNGAGQLVAIEERIETGPPTFVLALDDNEHAKPSNQGVDVSASAAAWAVPSAAFFVIAGAGATGLAWLVVQLLQRGVALGMFSRITQASVLRNSQRSVLNDLVQQNPGIHLKQLMRQSGYGTGATTHHLSKLQDTGLVQAIESGGYTCYFPAGQTDHRIMRATGAIKSAGARRILDHVVTKQVGKPRAIADALGMSPGTVSHHLKRLADAGLVEGGGRAGYTSTALASQALAG